MESVPFAAVELLAGGTAAPAAPGFGNFEGCAAVVLPAFLLFTASACAFAFAVPADGLRAFVARVFLVEALDFRFAPFAFFATSVSPYWRR
jgi:hypothetical protein